MVYTTKKRRMKIALSLVLVCVLLVPMFCFGASAKVGDEVRAAKKIISVVYDDSGSMFGESWCYANYAMQSLTALLNEKDELYITYMSSPDNAVKIDLSNIGGAVQGIRDWQNSSGTPASAVDTAANKLAGITEKDASAQFWLVVMTDGQMAGLTNTLQKKFDSLKSKKMSNESLLNVVYLGMGPSAEKVAEDKSGRLYSYESKNGQEIFSSMFSVANLISGRFAVSDIKQVNDTTVEFSSALPLYNISVLLQNGDAVVVKAATRETELDINRNIALDATDFSKLSDIRLFGNASVINKLDSSSVAQVIPADTYTVTFSKKVNISDLLMQYEPAIGIKVSLSSNGIEIPDTSKIVIGQPVDVTVEPVIPGTDTVISASDLPADLTWKIEYIVDDKTITSTESTKLAIGSVAEGKNIIRSTMSIKGYAPIVFEEEFSIENIVYNLGIEKEQPDPLEYYRKELHKGSKQGADVTFYITNDGQRLTKSQIEALGLFLNIDNVSVDRSKVDGFIKRLGIRNVDCVIQQGDNGEFVLVPQNKIKFTSFLLYAGDYTVDVSLSSDAGVSAQGKLVVTATNWDIIDLFWLILTILLIMYILRLLTKPKFHGEVIQCDTFRLDGEGGGILQRGLTNAQTLSVTKGLFSLRKSRASFGGYTIVADRGRTILVTGKSIAKNSYSYGTSAANPKTRLSSIARSLNETKQNDDMKIAQDVSIGEGQKLYIRETNGNQYIKCIYIVG